ncbi:dynein axonemal assembly factor 3 homolog [Phlebotomus papatasi]|uniref:dynein axonemal assembly factor 3 homolog n=1 Tax=Phlebotomus papatasi TaxID=29031 RepID=UPI0024837F65|nr:dynein axonemal assembly factor 3 homolog [Phlebotomus papatasi]
MFWGWSEVVNLIEKWQQYNKDEPLPKNFNILLFGPGDLRHILTILAKCCTFPEDVKIQIYLLDSCMEHVARTLQLLTVALESEKVLSLRGKTHLFMDIFGNSHLRPSSVNYIRGRSKFLIKIVTDCEFAKENLPMVDLGRLKYRERDELEATFSFWVNNGIPFEIKKQWDRRLRGQLGVRYDYRKGAFDWDLQMQLRDRGAGQICPQEYNQFRETGIGFVFPEFEQSVPNKTLAVKVNPRNTWAYLGDMSVGPFVSFGIACADEKILKSQHGVNDYRATDVTERNLREIFFEMQKKERYIQSPGDCHRFGAATFETRDILPLSGADGSLSIRDNSETLLNFKNISLTFLSPEDIARTLEQNEFHEIFSVIFIGNNFFSVFSERFLQTLTPNGIIGFETRRYTTFRKDKVIEYTGQIKDFSNKASLKSLSSSSINQQYSILFYKKE